MLLQQICKLISLQFITMCNYLKMCKKIRSNLLINHFYVEQNVLYTLFLYYKQQMFMHLKSFWNILFSLFCFLYVLQKPSRLYENSAFNEFFSLWRKLNILYIYACVIYSCAFLFRLIIFFKNACVMNIWGNFEKKRRKI